LEEGKEWLEENQSADKEEFEDQLKELQSVCDPIISKVHKDAKDSHDYDEDDNNYDLWGVFYEIIVTWARIL